MLEEMIEVLVPAAERDRSARAYMQLLAGLHMARADKQKVLQELDRMEFYHSLILDELDASDSHTTDYLLGRPLEGQNLRAVRRPTTPTFPWNLRPD